MAMPVKTNLLEQIKGHKALANPNESQEGEVHDMMWCATS